MIEISYFTKWTTNTVEEIFNISKLWQYLCNSFPKPPLIKWAMLMTLTQTWQCDIRFVDPTSPGVASAHTGSAPSWGAVGGTGSTHSRGRVNVFIHFTDCRNTDVIHIELLLRYVIRHSSLSRNWIIVLRSFECLFQPICITLKRELVEEVLINYSGTVSNAI